MSSKGPVTYGRLARLRAQRQAAAKSPAPDSDTDLIDLMSSPTPSPSGRKKPIPRKAVTAPRSRRLRDKRKTDDAASSVPASSPTHQHSAETRSSEINSTPSTTSKAPPPKRRRVDSGKVTTTEPARATEYSRSLRRPKESAPYNQEGMYTSLQTWN